jgi:peptide/nickel transport system permease protein
MFIVYFLIHSLPTSYIETVARQLATRPGNMKSVEQWMADLNATYGLSDNVFTGYFVWLGKAFKGDFGDSWYYSIPVVEEFKKVIWNSFYLGIAALLIEVLVAIPLGVISARKQYSLTDYSVTVTALIGISLPTFFVATLLKLVFSIKLNWFDISGMVSRNYISMTDTQQFFDKAWHFVLPIITLTVVGIGGLMRYTRTNMLEVLNSDYIRTARAKGLSERKVINRHAFRNTLIPIVTILGGSLPGLFAGALITETLFAIEGIGFASYHAMVAGDIPFTMFYLSFMSILTLLGNFISDILYAVVDPRVRIN